MPQCACQVYTQPGLVRGYRTRLIARICTVPMHSFSGASPSIQLEHQPSTCRHVSKKNVILSVLRVQDLQGVCRQSWLPLLWRTWDAGVLRRDCWTAPLQSGATTSRSLTSPPIPTITLLIHVTHSQGLTPRSPAETAQLEVSIHITPTYAVYTHCMSICLFIGPPYRLGPHAKIMC